MELELSPEQEMLRQSARSFFESTCPLDEVRARAQDSEHGYSREWWSKAAALGWTEILSFPGPEGVGQPGLRELCLIAQEMGRLVAPGPLVPVSIVSARLERSGTTPEHDEFHAALVSGAATAAWAFEELGGHWDGNGSGVRIQAKGDSIVLSGEKTPVEGVGGATAMLVAGVSETGLTQTIVPTGAPGVEVHPLQALDFVRRFSRVTFDDVVLPQSSLVGEYGGARSDIEEQLNAALCLQLAESTGALDRVFEFTLDYAFNRYSFGRPIASYQALKHRFALMKMNLEACTAIAEAAIAAVAAGDHDAPRLVSIAKSFVGKHAPEVVQECVQMHGAIGVTWEHDLHLYLRRITGNALQYGSVQQHQDRLATLLLATGRAR